MLPVHQDILNAGIKQSLLFINSFEFQWWKNILKIMKLVENQRNPIGKSFVYRLFYHLNLRSFKLLNNHHTVCCT